MIRKITRAALFAAALAPAWMPGAALAQQPVKLKFAIFTPDKEQTFLTTMKPFAEAVNKESRGAVEIELFPNGALGRSPMTQAQMVLDGVADIAWVIASYTPGRFQENEVLELPGLFRDLKESTTVYTRLVTSGQLKGYDDYFVIGTFGTAPYSIHSRGQINSLADIKGKKIRSSGAIEGATIKALGGVPIGMPVTEVPEAISRNTVDGTTSHPSPLFDFGIARVTSAHYFTRLGIVPLAILLNRKKFDSLPKAGQDAIRKYSGEWTALRFNEGIGAYNDSLVKQLQDDPKRKVVFPSEAELAATRAAYQPVVAEWAARTPRNAELLKAVESEIAKVRGGR
ncbi:MAG: TRAP transporter substrate-binding protein [Betaproteobacteria bacterium]|nr:TRAP transporter substrate-binding protein [Betaproteobacteria bacterium]